jgi:zinc D-Ala-D-Ala dipeptidase
MKKIFSAVILSAMPVFVLMNVANVTSQETSITIAVDAISDRSERALLEGAERLARYQHEEEIQADSELLISDSRTLLAGELAAQGLVNVRDIDPTLAVDLKYASPDNFMGEDVYGDLRDCYLVAEAALMLKDAHDRLKQRHPDLRLLLVDGLRPRRVQHRMWDIVKDTPMRRYVADPTAGSMHNYGAAVDITIIDGNGNRLDMGTPVDHFGILAQPREEERFLREGQLTEQQVANRRLLREVMTEAGFIPLAIEWWHFDAFDKATVRSRFAIIE